MADNIIKVNVTSNKQQRVAVSSAQVGTEITASSDTGKFWAQSAKNWAVSDFIVDNTDYSSKYYANVSKQKAQNSQTYAEAAQNTYNAFQLQSGEAIEELQTTKTSSIEEITTTKDTAIDSINSTKTTILNDIEFVADGEKEEIRNLANDIKEGAEDIINRVGISMFDTVLKDHILTYEESKGLALQGTYVYKEAVAGSRYGYADFYNKVVEEYNETSQEEIVNGVTVKVHSNGHKFYNIADKTSIDEFFNTIGSAWFYGVDTENECIFLPRNNYFIQATANGSEVGQSVQAGLPNHYHHTVSDTSVNTALTSSNYVSRRGSVEDGDYKYRLAGTSTAPTLGKTDNASVANSIYGNSDTVQPPAVKKLLYICVGNTETVSSITDVVDVTTTENDTVPLFTGQYFDFKPNNVSWLKGGEQANNAGIYATCYNELVNVLNGETKYGNLKVVDTANMIAGVDYSEYWKVNQDEMTFTTPTAISNKALSGAVKGNGMTLGFTDGTTLGGTALNTAEGGWGIAIYENMYGINVGTTGRTNRIEQQISVGITSDPTKSGIIAEQSTAQLYFKVANAVQNLELLNVGKVMEAVNNVVPNNSSLIAGYGMPSNRYVEFTVGASKAEYTAPANGWFTFSTEGVVVTILRNITKNIGMTAYSKRDFAGYNYVPAEKGDVVTLWYDSSSTSNSLRFIYAEGEV